MNILRANLLLLLLLSGIPGASASGCNARSDGNVNEVEQGNKQRVLANTPNEKNGAKTMSDDFEEIKGARFAIANPFVAIIRDAETYAALRGLSNGTLPDFNADYFKTRAIVAAFLGQRRTAGYSVKITNETNATQKSPAISIQEVTPPRGAMLAQVITAPFKIVSVPVDEREPLKIELGATWQTAARPYKIETSQFTASGGLAGRSERFQLQGAVRLLRESNLATFIFDATGVNANGSMQNQAARRLQDVATGVVDAQGNISVKRMDAGTLVPFPHPALSAQGKFEGEAESKIALNFTSLPTTIADGYAGSGKLEATATAPPRARKQPID